MSPANTTTRNLPACAESLPLHHPSVARCSDQLPLNLMACWRRGVVVLSAWLASTHTPSAHKGFCTPSPPHSERGWDIWAGGRVTGGRQSHRPRLQPPLCLEIAHTPPSPTDFRFRGSRYLVFSLPTSKVLRVRNLTNSPYHVHITKSSLIP